MLSGYLKAFKKHLKTLKAQKKGKIKGYGTRVARVVSRAKSKVKSIDNAFTMLMLLRAKSINTFARRHSLTSLSEAKKSKSSFQGE
jgi:hypothetical protein